MLVMEHDQPYVAPFIRQLMPDATEHEIVEASENLRDLLYALYDAFVAQKARDADHDSHEGRRRDRFAIEGDNAPAI